MQIKSFMSLILLFLSLVSSTFSSLTFEKVTWDNSLNDLSIADSTEKKALIGAIDNSLLYIKSSKAKEQYKLIANTSFTPERVEKSLLRFKEIIEKTKNPEELNYFIKKEFDVFKISDILFTGYYTETLSGSTTKSSEYIYPVFSKPANFEEIKNKSRVELEGKTGLETKLLDGNEIIYLKDRLSAYLLGIQGSGKITLTDGKVISLGFAGANNKEYSSIGKLLIQDKIIKPEDMSLQAIIDYFDKNHKAMDKYLPLNERMVFFTITDENTKGSLNVPLTPNRSIALDKTSIFPSGALGLIKTKLPDKYGKKKKLQNLSLTKTQGQLLRVIELISILE